MANSDYARVVGDDGLRGVVLGPSDAAEGEVAVELDDGREISVPASSLQRRDDDTWYLRGFNATAAPTGSSSAETVVPVIAEELNIDKRKRPTGRVRVTKQRADHDETVAMPLAREHAEVRRVLINREVDGPLPVRREGDTIIMPVVEEVPVVQKRLVLKEEIHITRRRSVDHHEETVRVRGEQANIERFDESGRSVSRPDEMEPVAAKPDLVREEARVLPSEERSVLDPTKPRTRFLSDK